MGVTSALWNRVAEHKNERYEGFTSTYGVKSLVWYEHHHYMDDAIRREKHIKAWKREWKFRIIETINPDWRCLHESIDTIATLVDPKAGPLPSQG